MKGTVRYLWPAALLLVAAAALAAWRTPDGLGFDDGLLWWTPPPHESGTPLTLHALDGRDAGTVARPAGHRLTVDDAAPLGSAWTGGGQRFGEGAPVAGPAPLMPPAIREAEDRNWTPDADAFDILGRRQGRDGWLIRDVTEQGAGTAADAPAMMQLPGGSDALLRPGRDPDSSRRQILGYESLFGID